VDLACGHDGRVVFAQVTSPADDHSLAKAFAEAAAYALAAGVPSDRVLLHGAPANAIINSAEACHADMIAIGGPKRMRNPFGSGSTAQEIVRMSHVPVLVMPAPATAPDFSAAPGTEPATKS
jgi:nucleotide-binding universal stress UspA family protein